jgi:hypothetical protein
MGQLAWTDDAVTDFCGCFNKKKINKNKKKGVVVQ